MDRGMKTVNIQKQKDIHFELSDREILLSFVNDDDSILFEEWWKVEGSSIFEDYLQNQKEL